MGVRTTDIAILVEGLSKQYRIGEINRYPMLREALTGAVKAPLRIFGVGRRRPRQTLWALDGIDMEVRQGSVVGLIGRNGAGKSTLLKVLSGITEPTAGSADIYGRVGSLLEVGTGFHMELSGRENIFLNGALLGMRRHEIRRRFDEIVAFSEVDRYLDTPVKHYSSGMYMRLAFAVAAHLEPEILIVDEVLAVGDAAFQKKCLGKMGEVARDGRTVLFVSHNMSTIQALCERVVWLDAGRVRDEGPTATVVRRYLEASIASTSTSVTIGERPDRQGDGSVRVESIAIEDADGDSILRTSSRMRITLGYRSAAPVNNLRAYVSVYDPTHIRIYLFDSDAGHSLPEQLPATGTLTCVTDPIRITPGPCYATVGLMKLGALVDRVPEAIRFDIEPDASPASGFEPTREWVMCTLSHRWEAEASGDVGAKALP